MEEPDRQYLLDLELSAMRTEGLLPVPTAAPITRSRQTSASRPRMRRSYPFMDIDGARAKGDYDLSDADWGRDNGGRQSAPVPSKGMASMKPSRRRNLLQNRGADKKGGKGHQ